MNSQLDMLEKAQGTMIDLAIKSGPKLVVAIAIMILGFYAGRWAGGVLLR